MGSPTAKEDSTAAADDEGDDDSTNKEADGWFWMATPTGMLLREKKMSVSI